MTEEKKKRSGCFLVFVWLLGAGLVFSVLLNLGLMASLALTGEAIATRQNQPVDEFPYFEEQWSYGDGETVVARIPLQGPIMREAPTGFLMPGEDPVELVLQQIRAARKDEAIRAILLEVDSPGGAVTPTDEIYHALRLFRESREDRRVMVFSRDVIASGAYYAAMAGDWLMVEPTSLVGSIGVLIQTLNWHELTDRLGVSDTTIKSGENKDILNPFRPVSTEETDILQDVVDALHGRFVDIVKEGRGFDDETIAQLADGRVYMADKALRVNLVDEIGYFDDAVQRLAEMLEVENVRIIRYQRRPDFWSLLTSVKTPDPLGINALKTWDHPRAMFIWNP
jgi:protease IV